MTGVWSNLRGAVYGGAMGGWTVGILNDNYPTCFVSLGVAFAAAFLQYLARRRAEAQEPPPDDETE